MERRPDRGVGGGLGGRAAGAPAAWAWAAGLVLSGRLCGRERWNVGGPRVSPLCVGPERVWFFLSPVAEGGTRHLPLAGRRTLGGRFPELLTHPGRVLSAPRRAHCFTSLNSVPPASSPVREGGGVPLSDAGRGRVRFRLPR